MRPYRRSWRAALAEMSRRHRAEIEALDREI
jgi:hypothetical protein